MGGLIALTGERTRQALPILPIFSLTFHVCEITVVRMQLSPLQLLLLERTSHDQRAPRGHPGTSARRRPAPALCRLAGRTLRSARRVHPRAVPAGDRAAQ